MKVAVTGGRNFGSGEAVFVELQRRHNAQPIGLLVHGACSAGVDSIAASWARSNGVDEIGYSANWGKNGKAAGPIRNREMLTTEKPDLVLVFPGGRGTRDCELQARKLGLKVELAATGYDANGRLLPVKDEW